MPLGEYINWLAYFAELNRPQGKKSGGQNLANATGAEMLQAFKV